VRHWQGEDHVPRPPVLGDEDSYQASSLSTLKAQKSKLGVPKGRWSWLCFSPRPGFFLTDGLEVFQAFLRTEFSEENLEFWLACEDFKKVKSQSKMAAKAKKIFAEFIAIQACKEVGPKASLSGPQFPWPSDPSAARR
jgi:hypothetical protein